jgi:KTSC domain
MAKKNSLPSWDDMNKDSNVIPNRNPNVPTYDEIIFGRQVEQRTDRREAENWDVTIPQDIKDANEVELDSVGSTTAVAPTKNPKRPRALTIGYNPNTRTLIVVFRDNTWWQYNDVPVHMWIGLRDSGSTGEFLKTEGLDTWPDMGPADMGALSAGITAQIAESAQTANNIQKGKESAFKALNLQSFTAEELFKDYL